MKDIVYECREISAIQETPTRLAIAHACTLRYLYGACRGALL